MFRGRKIVILLVSLLAAGLLWLYVVSTVAPETTGRVDRIPVTIDGSIVLEERGLIITNQATTNITLEVSTSRLNLSKLKESGNIRISADASKIREPGTYDLSYTIIFPDTVNSNDVDILRKTSDRVTVTVERLDTKTIPVNVLWQGSAKEGYTAETGSSTIDPAEIVLTGPENEIDRIAEARINFDYSNLDQTVIQSVPVVFLDAEGRTVKLSEFSSASAEEAVLTLQILREKEITLRVELIPGGGVQEENAKVTYNPETIFVKGPADKVDAMEDVMIIGTPIDLSNLVGHTTYSFDLTFPVGVINESGKDTAEVEVDLEGILTDSVDVTDIRLINVPEGYDTALTTRSVKVTIRGSQEEIALLKRTGASGIFIEVDLDGVTQTGSFTLRGRVVNSAHPEIGTVEEVQIGISMTKKS